LSLIVKPVDGRTFDIYLKDAGSMVISLYTVTGTQVASMNVSGDNATVSAPGNQPGIMIMRIVTPTGTFTRKLAVR
ncbi:MAG: T9SS type A sorting domain-containing protein, partial [Muribaculaceae bacterium]|nr:T9SS type A sorting domain-containing protein [Muribaculaceae bacterium]